MLLPVVFRKYCPIAIVLAVICVLVTSWTLFPHKDRSNDSLGIGQAFSANKQETPGELPLPSIYSSTDRRSEQCSKRLGIPFLTAASNTSLNYCDDACPSSLTCFRARASPERIDPFCIGSPAVFDRDEKKYRLACTLRDLTEEQVAAGIPTLSQFPHYWYETGPRLILDRHVNINAKECVPSRSTGFPRNYTILVRREDPIDNIFHHFMQIFSIYLTLDVLQLVADPATGQPFFRAEDIENTRVVIFDSHDEGPFYDQWRAFAKRPMLRSQDLQSDPVQTPETIIVPLPGVANPFWQDDWVPNACEESKLLQVFSQRMLNFYGIKNDEDASNGSLVLTFIDRTEKRSLVDKKAYIDNLRHLYPKLTINLVNLASLPFAEQIKIIRKTDILAGVHGAGLTHSIFLQPGSTVVEIMPHNFNHKGFRNLAKIAGHRYFRTHAIEHENYTTDKGWQYDDVFIEQDRFINLMDGAIKSMYHRGLLDEDVN